MREMMQTHEQTMVCNSKMQCPFEKNIEWLPIADSIQIFRLQHCCMYPTGFYQIFKTLERMGTTKKTAPRNHYNYLVGKSNRVMMIIKRKPSLLPDQHANVE
jgi:hypothetical protein